MTRRLLTVLVVAFVALCGLGLWLTRASSKRGTAAPQVAESNPSEPLAPMERPRMTTRAPASDAPVTPRQDAGLEETSPNPPSTPAPVAPPPAPLIGGSARPHPPAPPEARGSIDEEAIRVAIDSVKPLIRECFEDAQDRFPPPQKVTLRFTIIGQGISGHFDEGEIQESTIVDPWVQSCFLDSLIDARFPVPEGGGKVTVTYPFRYEKNDAGAQP